MGSLLDAINRLSYNANERATPADALNVTRNSVFTSGNIRPYARKIAVLLIVAKPLDDSQR